MQSEAISGANSALAGSIIEGTCRDVLSRVTVGVDAVSQSYISRRPGGRVGEGKGDKGKVKGKGKK